jgi:hypothetical protein
MHIIIHIQIYIFYTPLVAFFMTPNSQISAIDPARYADTDAMYINLADPNILNTCFFYVNVYVVMNVYIYNHIYVCIYIYI